jgi:hypothetical protein
MVMAKPNKLLYELILERFAKPRERYDYYMNNF